VDNRARVAPAGVDSAQRSVRSRLPAANVTRRYVTVPAIALEVSEETLLELIDL